METASLTPANAGGASYQRPFRLARAGDDTRVPDAALSAFTRVFDALWPRAGTVPDSEFVTVPGLARPKAGPPGTRAVPGTHLAISCVRHRGNANATLSVQEWDGCEPERVMGLQTERIDWVDY